MLAAQRARDVSAGAPLSLDRDNDKNPVVALREIADSTIDLDHLRYEMIHGLRRHVDAPDEPDDLAQELEALMPSRPLESATGDDELPEGMNFGDDDVMEDED